MANSLPILAFHSLDDQPSAVSFSPLLFRQCMANLHKSGFRTLSLREAADLLRERVPFPVSSFVITFDDGYQTVFDEAYPVLQDFGFSATVFIAVGEKSPADQSIRLRSMNGRPMLNWREIGQMHSSGISIGSHTLTHTDLTKLPLNRIEAEIDQSKAIIEDFLGDEISCFAYPYGRSNRQIREIVRQRYDCACSSQLGLVGAKSDPYALERVETYYFRNRMFSSLMLNPFFSWYLQARRIPRAVRQALMRGFI